MKHLKKYRIINKNVIICILVVLFAGTGTYFLVSSHAATTLSADFNGDNTVNILDLSILAANWGKTNATSTTGDANGDGKVNILDLSILASEWGQTISNGGQPANSINVKNYGVVGDGTTDDTAKLLSAINMAISQSKIAYIPDGTYKLTNLVIPDKAIIQGQDMIGTWLKGQVTAGSNQSLSYFKVGDLGDSFKFTNNASSTTIDHVHFRGGGSTTVSNSPVILFGGSGSIYQHNITINNSEIERNLGVIQTGKYNDYSLPQYDNVSFTAQATAGGAHVTNVLFENSHFGVSNGQPGHNTGAPKFNVEIWQDDAAGKTQVQGYQHIDFIDNVWEAPDTGQLDYAGAHNWSTGYCLTGNSIISGNLFKGNGYLSTAPWHQDICFEPACDMTVENNTFWGGDGYAGVAIESHPTGYGYSQNNVFKNNTIDFTQPSGITFDYTKHIPFAISGINNEYSNNTIIMNQAATVFNISNGNANKIINNHITIKSSQAYLGLFVFGSTSDTYAPAINNTVSGNTFYIPNVIGKLKIQSGSTGNSFSNNSFYGLGLPSVSDLTGTFQFSNNKFTQGAPPD